MCSALTQTELWFLFFTFTQPMYIVQISTVKVIPLISTEKCNSASPLYASISVPLSSSDYTARHKYYTNTVRLSGSFHQNTVCKHFHCPLVWKATVVSQNGAVAESDVTRQPEKELLPERFHFLENAMQYIIQLPLKVAVVPQRLQ